MKQRFADEQIIPMAITATPAGNPARSPTHEVVCQHNDRRRAPV